MHLVKEKSYEILNSRLDNLKDKIYETIIHDDKYFHRNDLIKEVQTIKLNNEDLQFITAENILFYLNYNNQFAMKKVKMIPYEQRVELLNRFLEIDLLKDVNMMNIADFLQWTLNYFCKDEDMAKLMRYFCQNADYRKSSLIFDVYSIYVRLPDDFKCKNIIVAKHNKMLKDKEEKQKSRIIL